MTRRQAVRFRTRVAVICSCIIALAATAAHAAPAISRDREAAQLFEVGTDALQKGRYLAARDALRRSLDRLSRAPTAFNLAVAHRKAGEPKQAVALLEQLLEGTYGELGPEQLADVREELGAAQAALARIQVSTRARPGTRLRVDSEVNALLGLQNSLELALNPGIHELTLEGPSGEKVSHRVELNAGQSLRLRLVLPGVERPGRLVVRAGDKRRRVEITGVASASERLERELPPGTYVVRYADGEPAGERRVELQEGQLLRVDLRATREGPSLLSNPWFWSAAAVLVVGGGVSTYLLLRDQDPPHDPVFGITQTLKMTF